MGGFFNFLQSLTSLLYRVYAFRSIDMCMTIYCSICAYFVYSSQNLFFQFQIRPRVCMYGASCVVSTCYTPVYVYVVTQCISVQRFFFLHVVEDYVLIILYLYAMCYIYIIFYYVLYFVFNVHYLYYHVMNILYLCIYR